MVPFPSVLPPPIRPTGRTLASASGPLPAPAPSAQAALPLQNWAAPGPGRKCPPGPPRPALPCFPRWPPEATPSSRTPGRLSAGLLRPALSPTPEAVIIQPSPRSGQLLRSPPPTSPPSPSREKEDLPLPEVVSCSPAPTSPTPPTPPSPWESSLKPASWCP